MSKIPYLHPHKGQENLRKPKKVLDLQMLDLGLTKMQSSSMQKVPGESLLLVYESGKFLCSKHKHENTSALSLEHTIYC